MGEEKWLCPFLKGECVKEKCKMWNKYENECKIVLLEDAVMHIRWIWNKYSRER